MGYSTDFSGVLKFTNELSASQLAEINKYLGEDCRDHPEWDSGELTYIDLELTEDFSGIQWDGSEKTYDLVEKINFIIDQMKLKYPKFSLSGQLKANGEEFDDIWILGIENDKAVKIEVKINGTKITCPNCEHEFLNKNK